MEYLNISKCPGNFLNNSPPSLLQLILTNTKGDTVFIGDENKSVNATLPLTTDVTSLIWSRDGLRIPFTVFEGHVLNVKKCRTIAIAF